MTRPRTVAAIALGVALVAGVGVAALTRGPRDTASLATVPVTPVGTTAPPVTATPSPSESPAPTPTPEETTASPTTRATTKPAATGDPVHADFGPMAPGTVNAPYRPGQTSWDVTTNGMRIRLTIPATVQMGVATTFRIATSGPGKCCLVSMLWGDGYRSPRQGPACDQMDSDVSFGHTYNSSGRESFMVQVSDHGCRRHGTLIGAFDVLPGQWRAQGPALPEVAFDRSTPVKGHEDDPRYVSLWGEGSDEDGYVTKLVVSFGDGTSKTFPGDQMECARSSGGWAIESSAQLPYNPPPYHFFKNPGTYTLTMTVYSAGCNGTMVQSAKKSFEWTVPDPDPEPEPTPTASPTS